MSPPESAASTADASVPAVPSEPSADLSVVTQSAVSSGTAWTRGPLPWALLIPFALGPVLLAALQTGRWHADEVYQYLEPAWWRVHGYGVLAWEWRVGLRNWATPIVLSWFIRLGEALGASDPRVVRVFVGLPLLALHGGAMIATWRYLERRFRHHGRGSLILAFVFVAAFAPVIAFSGRTMGENISAGLLVIAFEALDRDRIDRPWRSGILAGVMLGLSVVVRYGSGVFVVAALVWLLATRRWRAFLSSCASGLVIAGGLAALDWATWGKPFHSFFQYVDFNLISGGAVQQFGSQPGWFYLPILGAWVAFWSWPGLVGAIWRERRIPLPVFAAVVYLTAISVTAHKEERFLYPALVFIALGTAAGLVDLLRRIRGVVPRFAITALALFAGCVPWFYMNDFRGDEFRAQVIATRPPEVTGLLIVGEGIWGSGGYFYQGRNVPFFNADLVPHIHQTLRMHPEINRVITFDGLNRPALEAAGFQLIGRVGREDILAKRR